VGAFFQQSISLRNLPAGRRSIDEQLWLPTRRLAGRKSEEIGDENFLGGEIKSF